MYTHAPPAPALAERVVDGVQALLATPAPATGNQANEDPLALLGELVDALARGRPAPARSARWFVAGVSRAINRGDSLDSALELAAPGQRSMQRRLSTIRRDLALVDAVAAVSLDPAQSQWQRCCRLAPYAKAFAEAWPRVRRLPAAPKGWPAWKQALFRAAQSDVKLPVSARALHDVVRGAEGYSPRGTGGTLLAELLLL